MNKICTSLEQSKKLIELGIDRKTSDMYYWCGVNLRIGSYKTQDEDLDIPAWSLTALLNALPVSCDDGQHCLALINSNPNGEIEWLCCYEDCYGDMMMECYADNPVDACYELILKLKEEDLL